MSETKYTHATYGMSFKTRGAEVITIQPGWFARVFLRRKPRTVNIGAMAEQLGKAAREAQEKALLDLLR